MLMHLDENEEKLLRSVALQNARAVLIAREKAERELLSAKEALNNSNQQVTNILERISDGFVALDPQWRFTYLNHRGAEIFARFQKEKGSLLGRILWDEFPDLLGTEIEQNYRRAVMEQVTVEFETLLPPLDEWYIIRAYPSADGLSIYLLDISRRKRTEADRSRTEEALRASEQHFRAAFNQAAVGMAVAALDGRFEEVNDRFCEILGFSREELLTRTFTDVTFIKANDTTKERARQLLAGEIKDYTYEKRFVRKDGTLVWTLTSVTLLVGEAGKPERFIGVIDDITLRKNAEELRSRLAAVVESSDDAIISMGLDTIVATWNKGAEQMFGYSVGEMVGQSIEILLPKGHENEETKILDRIIQGERIEHYETVRSCKDGRLVDVSLSVSPIHDAEGKLIGVSKISRDITDRKRAEQALREESRVLEILNETGKAIASQLDLERVVQIVTDSATRLSGAGFGAFFYNVINPDGEAFVLLALSGAPREAFEKFGNPRATPLFAPTFRGEVSVRIADVTKDPRYGKMAPHHGMPQGHLPVCSYLAVPVISRSGVVIGGLFFGHPEPNIFTERAERLVAGVAAQAAVAIDNARLYDAAQHEIDQRKQIESELRSAQEQLRSHADNLENLITERTAKLRETIGELEAFSYSVSHDMRSPLRAMQGYAEALLDEYSQKLDETGEDYLNRIRRAASRMDLLIQDVLAYSRVAQGEVPLKPVALESVIRDVIQSYPTLQPDQARITIVADLPGVIGHEAYLTQAVSNILTNGVKFVAPGVFPEISIGASREGDYVRVYFQDNGVGIAPGHRQRIFQIFGRVYSEKQYEGTGIGLAIAKKATERMGGSIGVSSELGRGSCFYLLLKPAP
jgi:PAS domain S-box-containing protein